MSGGFEHLTVALAAKLAGGAFSVGTGVPVAPGLVLTARHVVQHDKVTDEPVLLRFWHATEREFRPDDVRGKDGFLSAISKPELGSDGARGIVWSCADLDLALVAVSHPPSINTARISRTEPSNNTEWLAEAFPHAAWENGAPEPVRLKGTSHSRFPNTQRFQVDSNIAMVDPAGQNVARGWSGASGAALFVHGQLLGVLLARKPNGEAKILEAVPTVDCLADESFRRAVGFDYATAETYLDALSATMARILPLPRARFATALGQPEDISDADLARALAARSLHDGFKLLKGLRSGADALSPGILRDITLQIAALKSAPDNVADLHHAAFGRSAKFDACTAGTRMGAEFLMAAAENRQPHFKSNRESAITLLEGTYALPQLPEHGCHDDRPAVARDLEARLGVDLMNLDNWLEDSMGAICDFPLDSSERIGHRRELLQDELAYRAEQDDPEPSYYFAEADPGENRPTEREALRDRVETIRQHYPELGLVFIKSDRARDERRKYRPLLDLLPKEVDHD